MSWGNLTQLSPFDVLTTYTSATNISAAGTVSVNVEDTPGTVGGQGFTSDGRKFRLGTLITGGTTLAACKLTQSATQVAGFILGTVSAQSAGDTSLTYTFAGGAATVLVNALSGGYLSVVTGTGAPQFVQIAGNPAVTSSTTITINLQDPLVLATAVSDTAQIIVNPYSNIIIAPNTVPTATTTGVPQVAVTSNSNQPVWAWFQTGGIGTCLGEGTITIGMAMTPSDTTAGAVETIVDTGVPQVAEAVQTGGNGLYSLFKLQLD